MLHVNDLDTASLSGRSVLIVEDEALVAMMLEDLLLEFGCNVVGPAMSIGSALEMAGASARPDVAVLDVNVAGEEIYPVAEALDRTGVPIVFATGYGNAGLRAEWRSRPTLQKPYLAEDVASALKAALSRA